MREACKKYPLPNTAYEAQRSLDFMHESVACLCVLNKARHRRAIGLLLCDNYKFIRTKIGQYAIYVCMYIHQIHTKDARKYECLLLHIQVEGVVVQWQYITVVEGKLVLMGNRVNSFICTIIEKKIFLINKET